MLRTLAFVAVFFVLPAQDATPLPPCAAVADPALFTAKTWADLHSWTTKWSQCDDGYLAEGVSDIIATWLSERWQTLPALARECRKDPKFKAFVLRHIDELMSPEQFAQISQNARKHCPTRYRSLCKDIAAALEAVPSGDISQHPCRPSGAHDVFREPYVPKAHALGYLDAAAPRLFEP